MATIVLGSILGGLVVLVGIGIYKRDAVLDKLEEFLRRRKTARSRDQPQELADVSVTLQPQDQQQQTQPCRCAWASMVILMVLPSMPI